MSPDQTKPFEIGDLVKLNEELKQIREILRRKRMERDQARHHGIRPKVDLTPEIQRLIQFSAELNRVSVAIKGSHLRLHGPKDGESIPLIDALNSVKTEIQNEKNKLEVERAAREEEELRHRQELQELRDEVQRNKELLITDQRSLGTTVTKTIEDAERLQPEPDQNETTKQPPGELQLTFSAAGFVAQRAVVPTQIEQIITETKETRIEAKPTSVSPQEDKPNTAVEVTNEIRSELRKQLLQNEELRMDLRARVSDEFTAIRAELQTLKEHIQREQDTLDGKRQELDLERAKLEQERKLLETRIADTLTASKSELEHIRDQITHNQSELEARERSLYSEKVKIEEERKLLGERAKQVEHERLQFTTHRIVEEIEAERAELIRLKRSLQQLRAESVRDRERLESDRSSILRARVALENEKRKTAWKNALIEIKARQLLVAQKSAKKMNRTEKKTQQPTIKKDVDTNMPPPSSATEDGAVMLGVRLGEENYGIDISRVREIMRRQLITPVPRQPAYVEGVMNVRGTIIPVVNLRRRFDLKGQPSGEPHTVIVDSVEGLVGILVDAVSKVIRVPAGGIHPTPAITSGLDGEYLRGICKVGEQLLLYLDVEKILRQATPISILQTAALTPSGKPKLTSDEQRILRQLPSIGAVKSRLKRKTGFNDARLQSTISSLRRKGLVRIHKRGNRKIVSRAPPPPRMMHLRRR